MKNSVKCINANVRLYQTNFCGGINGTTLECLASLHTLWQTSYQRNSFAVAETYLTVIAFLNLYKSSSNQF